LDDKHKISVGEPGNPVATGVRAHHAALVVGEQVPYASDHDSRVVNLTPSGILDVDIPSTAPESFHRGRFVIGFKVGWCKWKPELVESARFHRLKLNYDNPLSNCAFNLNLRPSMKDAIQQPSTAMRHMVELKGYLKAKPEQVKPIACAIHDGGPDHNSAF